MSIRWIREVLLNGESTTLEVQMGDRHIGDKCYIRKGTDLESWFTTVSADRDEDLEQGKDLMRQRFADATLTDVDGSLFLWK